MTQATRNWYQGVRQPWESLLTLGVLETRMRLTAPNPVDDPLDLATVRDLHLRVTNGTVEDDYITHLIRVSLEMAEDATERAILPQRWTVAYNRFPDAEIVLPYPPLLEVESVVYLDEDGGQVTWDDAEYVVRKPVGPRAQRARIHLTSGGSWPTTTDTISNAIQVTFRCGYMDQTVSPEAVNVPADLTHARLLLVAEFYKQRSESVIRTGSQNTPAFRTADALFKRYRAY